LRTAETGDLSSEWAESAAERDDVYQKKANQRSLFRGARDEIARALRTRQVKGSLRDYPFSEYRLSEFKRNGRSLMRLVDKSRADELADRWGVPLPEKYASDLHCYIQTDRGPH